MKIAIKIAFISIAFAAESIRFPTFRAIATSFASTQSNSIMRGFVEAIVGATKANQNLCTVLLEKSEKRALKHENWVKYTFYYEEYKETKEREFLSELREMTQTARANYYTEIVRVVQRLEENGIIVDLNLQTLVHLKQYFIDVRVFPQIDYFETIERLIDNKNLISKAFKRTLQTFNGFNGIVLTNVFGVSSFLTDLEFSVFNESVNFESIQSFRMRKRANNRFSAHFENALSESEKFAFEDTKGGSQLYNLLFEHIKNGGRTHETFDELAELIESVSALKYLNGIRLIHHRTPFCCGHTQEEIDRGWNCNGKKRGKAKIEIPIFEIVRMSEFSRQNSNKIQSLKNRRFQSDSLRFRRF